MKMSIDSFIPSRIFPMERPLRDRGLRVSFEVLSGIGRWGFGSVTDKLVHAGDTPVMVVRAASSSS